MSKRVIRSLNDSRFSPDINGKKRAHMPIGLDRFNSVRSTRLDLFRPRSVSKTKNLIKYLLGHGTRAQRATLPKRYTKLRVISPNGVAAVKLSFR